MPVAWRVLPSLMVHAWAHALIRRYIPVMAERRPCPGDLSDARWALNEPVLSAWRAERRRHVLNIGRPPGHDLREIMNAVLYIDRTGVRWRYLPHDCVRDRRAEHQDLHQRPGRRAGHGCGQEDRGPQAEHRHRHPRAAARGAGHRGERAGLRRRHRPDRPSAAAHPSVRKVWVDGGYRQHLVEHAARLGIDMEIVQRTPGTRGFTPLPKRWTVERTYGWLMFHRRLARDYEALPARSKAMIHLTVTDLMARRLTGEAAISWRDPTPPNQTHIPE
jgi:transposase